LFFSFITLPFIIVYKFHDINNHININNQSKSKVKT